MSNLTGHERIVVAVGDAILAPTVTRRLIAKLDCRDRVQAVVTAYRSGVMDDVN